MILSDDRQSHFARLITDKLWADDLVDFRDDEDALRLAKKGIAKFVQEAVRLDEKARATIASLKRGVSEGSQEYEALYAKYYEQEMQRSGFGD